MGTRYSLKTVEAKRLIQFFNIVDGLGSELQLVVIIIDLTGRNDEELRRPRLKPT